MISNLTLPDTEQEEAHWLLVIDHHEARIFRTKMHGAVPQQILQHEEDDYFRHPHGAPARGKERPDPKHFFELVAKSLEAAKQLLIFGTGQGMSSEMEQFIGWAKSHQKSLAKRIIGSLRVDQHQMTRDQLLAKAREFYKHSYA